MHIALPRAKGDGRNTMAHHPVGVEPAVRCPQCWLQPGDLGSLKGMGNDGRTFLETKRIIVEALLKAHFGRSSLIVLDRFAGFHKRLLISLGDRADKWELMAARFAVDQDVI